MVQLVGFLLLMWETWTEFPTPSLDLEQTITGIWGVNRECENSFSPSHFLSLPVTLPLKNIHLKKRKGDLHCSIVG